MAPWGVLLIKLGSLKEPWIVLYANGAALGLAGEEKTHPAFAAAIIQQSIFLAYQAGAGCQFQDAVVCGFIGISCKVGDGVIPACGLERV